MARTCYQYDGMSMFLITLLFEIMRQLETWHAIHTAHIMKEMIHNQCCLLSDSAFDLYIIVFVIYSLYFQNKYCLI